METAAPGSFAAICGAKACAGVVEWHPETNVSAATAVISAAPRRSKLCSLLESIRHPRVKQIPVALVALDRVIHRRCRVG